MFDKLMAKYKEEIANKVSLVFIFVVIVNLLLQTTEPIKITLPDGKQFDGESWRTTPIEIAEKISKGLAENTVIAKVYIFKYHPISSFFRDLY